jgi:hypothetical protein
MNFLPREGIPNVTSAHEWIGRRGVEFHSMPLILYNFKN